MISIEGVNWSATVLVHSEPDDFFHLEVKTSGATQDDALAGATHVLDAFAKGRFAFVRVKPEAASYTDFDTKVTTHKGFVRFSYKLEPGEWHYSEELVNLGFGEMK